ELGWRLARHESLWGPSLWMAASAVTAILVGAALLYQCDPCVISQAARQLALTASVGVVAWPLQFVRRRRSPYAYSTCRGVAGTTRCPGHNGLQAAFTWR